MELTSQDINILFEALEAWEKITESEALTSLMFGTLFSSLIANSPEGRKSACAEAKRHGDEKIRMAKLDRQARREQSVLIQAKLISMRNKLQERELT